MALICSGVFKGNIPLSNVYVKLAIISRHSTYDSYVAVFRVYADEYAATNFPEDYIDSFYFEFPGERDNMNPYSEAYEVLKNGSYVIDRFKYNEDGSLRYTNNAYFPNITSMVDA